MNNNFESAVFADITDAVRHVQRQTRVKAVRAAAFDRIGVHGDTDFAAWAAEMGWAA